MCIYVLQYVVLTPLEAKVDSTKCRRFQYIELYRSKSTRCHYSKLTMMTYMLECNALSM